MYWAKNHLKYLRMWRRAAESIAEAIRDLGVEAEAYVIGGAAEDRLTVLSDVDILLCLKEPANPEEIWNLRKRIIGKAIDDHGLPWDYPIELHIHNMEEGKQLLKLCKKYVKIL